MCGSFDWVGAEAARDECLGCMTSRATSARGRWLFAVLALGVGARVWVWTAKSGFLYPDEIFQYLEPANWKLTGMAWLPWEFERGLRNWLLPYFYGAWMWWGRLAGLHGYTIQRALCLHNALLSVLLVPMIMQCVDHATERSNHGGAAGGVHFTDEADVAVARGWVGVVVALYPPILYYMPHTLSEVPGVLLTTGSWLWFLRSLDASASSRSKYAVLWSGVLAGAAVLVRPTLVFWCVVQPFVWLMAGRWRAVVGYGLAATLPLIIGGLVDWVTWGRFFHSTIEYVKYNYIENGASDHGVSPREFYLAVWFWERMGAGGIVMLTLALLGGRAAWWTLTAAAVPVLVLSTIEHKEERFLLSSTPLVVLAAGLGLMRVLSWVAGRDAPRARRWWLGSVAALAALVLGVGARGMSTADWHWRAGVFEGQRAVSLDPRARGVLVDDRMHMNGGYTVLDRNIPQAQFMSELVAHPIFNYAVIPRARNYEDFAAEQGFRLQRVERDRGVWFRDDR
jgi:phosphatidylinositol glycan class B